MNHRFDGQSTASDVIDGIDLAGKTFLVTGSSSGLGLETVRVLAKAGAQVVMVARDKARNEHAAEQVRAEIPGASLPRFTMDLENLDSVRRAAAEILEAFSSIDCLINNAGFIGGDFALTAEGVERHFAVNHLGPFLFTNLLIPALMAAAPSRVVMVSSNAHRALAFDLDDLNFSNRSYDHWSAYAQSKRATVLYAVELSRRLAGTGVTVTVLHPGVIPTDVFRHMPAEEAQSAIKSAEQYGVAVKSVGQGAATQVWAATAPELDGVTGVYLEDCQIAPKIPSTVPSAHGIADEALDPVAAARLWSLSEQILGQTFALSADEELRPA